MDARDSAIESLQEATAEYEAQRPALAMQHLVMAIKHHLDAIDEDLQKLRKELRNRNGGEHA